MDTRYLLRIARAVIVIAATAARQPAPAQESLANRILRMSEVEQIAYTSSALNHGLPADETGPLVMLILNRSSLVLPMMERKIEEVLNCASPPDCFTNKTVDPKRFVDLAAASIAYAGDEQALKEISKLIAIDEKRFGPLVQHLGIGPRHTKPIHGCVSRLRHRRPGRGQENRCMGRDAVRQ
jgi:hypothetical protein